MVSSGLELPGGDCVAGSTAESAAFRSAPGCRLISCFQFFRGRTAVCGSARGRGEILHQFRDDQVQSATWEVHGVKCILTDPAGRIWMGTKAGLAVWSGNDRRFLATNDNLTLPAVRAEITALIEETAAGIILQRIPGQQ